MNRSQFAALAAALSDNGASNQLIDAIADVCEASNPRFDRQRFYDAAGMVEMTDEDWAAIDRHARGEGSIVRIVHH